MDHETHATLRWLVEQHMTEMQSMGGALFRASYARGHSAIREVEHFGRGATITVPDTQLIQLGDARLIRFLFPEPRLGRPHLDKNSGLFVLTSRALSGGSESPSHPEAFASEPLSND